MYFMVDVEANGPIPGDYSLISIGAIVVTENLENAPTFYGKLAPLHSVYIPEALRVSGHSFEETCAFDDPYQVMLNFDNFIKQNTPPGQRSMFVSDNNGFDYMFCHWYFIHFLGSDPFGHTSMNLGSFYKGIVKNTRKNFKHLRRTKHTHHPVDDARGNAEAFLTILQQNHMLI